jgi:hypothetical protein
MSITKIGAALLLVAAVGLTGCSSTSSTKTTDTKKTGSMGVMPVNKTCPMSGEAVNGSSSTINYQGKTVGFCCDGCAGKFQKLSDADKAAKLATASK